MPNHPPQTENIWQEPARQARAATLFIGLEYLRRAMRQAWPLFLIVYIRGGAADGFTRLLYLALLITGVQLVVSIIAWFRFYFYIENDELIVQQGVFSLKRSSIPLTRIQSLQFDQNVLHKQFGVVKVRIETAGSKGTELSINALEQNRAEDLRRFIITRKADLQDSDPEAALAGMEGEGGEEAVSSQQPRESLLQLPLQALLYVGLTRNHLRTAAFIVGGLLTLYQFAGDLRAVPGLEELVERITGIAPQTIVQTGLLSVALLAMASVLGSLVQAVLRYYQLDLQRDEEGFHLVSGLLNRRQQLMRHEKLQYLRSSQNPLQARMGLWVLTLFQVGGQTAARQSMVVPGVDESARETVRQGIFPAEAEGGLTWSGVHPRVIRRYFILVGLIPIVPALTILIGEFDWWGLLALLWLLPAYWLARRYYREFRYGLNGQIMRVKSALFLRHDVQLWLYKGQAVDISQNIFQQRLGLADLTLHMAAGSVSVPYLPLQVAEEVRDYLLYRVEVSQEDWM